MSSPFSKQTVYQKDLRAVGEVVVIITCDVPEPCRFDRDKMQISFKCEGKDHYYVVENEACGEALSGLKGKTVAINAIGAREEATIEVFDAQDAAPRSNGRNAQQPSRQQQQQQQSAPPERKPAQRNVDPTTLSPEDREKEEVKAFKRANSHGARCTVLMEMAYRRAQGLMMKLQLEQNPVALASLAHTLFIEMKSMVTIPCLPAKWIDTAPATQPARQRQPEPPPREPEPADDLEEDDIPF